MKLKDMDIQELELMSYADITYKLLKENNLTAYKLSYKAGISNSIISDCRRGKVKEPTISSIIHICEGLNIQLKDFFDSPLFTDVEALDRFEK